MIILPFQVFEILENYDQPCFCHPDDILNGSILLINLVV